MYGTVENYTVRICYRTSIANCEIVVLTGGLQAQVSDVNLADTSRIRMHQKNSTRTAPSSELALLSPIQLTQPEWPPSYPLS
jgi:hypothetical protein